jgi:pilus assembly protein Flp/PilA
MIAHTRGYVMLEKIRELKKVREAVLELRRDEAGAALVEYSILIGLIAALVIFIILWVGGWVVDAWQTLQAALESSQGTTP